MLYIFEDILGITHIELWSPGEDYPWASYLGKIGQMYEDMRKKEKLPSCTVLRKDRAEVPARIED